MDKELLIKEFQSAIDDERHSKEAGKKRREEWVKERNTRLSENELIELKKWQKDVENWTRESRKKFDPEKANIKLDSWRRESMDSANKKLEEREFSLVANDKFKSSKFNTVLEKLKIV